jgi:hypothetical protein
MLAPFGSVIVSDPTPVLVGLVLYSEVAFSVPGRREGELSTPGAATS